MAIRGKDRSDQILNRINRKTAVIIITVFLFVVLIISPQLKSLIEFPAKIKVIEGEQFELNIGFPIKLTIKSDKEGILKINGDLVNSKDCLNIKRSFAIESLEQGKVQLDFKLFGLIPFKKMEVEVIPKVKVIPGGHSIGVKLRSKGVIVVGFSMIPGTDSRETCPGKEAGLQLGDLITEINDVELESVDHMAEIINNNGGKPLKLKVKRDKVYKEITLVPKYNYEDETYQIGIWIRDIAAGVGTLTFYEPNRKIFGALGHIISDVDTGKPFELGEGEIINAKVAAIEKGKRNQPGEKKGVFIEENEVIGKIIKNTKFGIYGILKTSLENPIYNKSIPVALVSQVKEGPAEILTVIDNDKIEKYDIKIIRLFNQNGPREKGMIIKITDKKLLSKTGGIIQGMSGSPIIQNGKLVGAVTHVFVNDPTKGYGIFAEWMIYESGILDNTKVSTN
ncbi:MAG: stage sporulation protein [Thermosediminibacterales bacterium]|nr:stage sporulation protein [Thermosediminibacterales bacterium]